MCKMTIVHLGVIVYAICLATQVFSQNSTVTSTWMNSSNNSTPTMATDMYSGSSNTTPSPTGAGISLHTSASSSALLPMLVALTSFLQSLS